MPDRSENIEDVVRATFDAYREQRGDDMTDPAYQRDERIEAAKAQLRAEFNDPITVWHRTGEDAWDTIIGMFTHTGWTPPDA